MTTSEVTTNPAAARVQRVAAPIASPGSCAICGKSEHEKGFADPRLDFEFYGTFYLCADCVGDFATLFGWIAPDQAIALAKRCDYLEGELNIHREALLNLESSVEYLTNYRMLRSTIPDSDSSDSVGEPITKSESEVDEAVSGSVIEFPSATTEAESDVSELATEQGSNDVPSTTGDEPSDQPIFNL